MRYYDCNMPHIFDTVTIQLLIAAALGSVIGLERELARKDPSLRTFMLVCLGSCIISIVSYESAIGIPNAEPSRIAAQIVTGIGFIGAGTIFRSRERINGLTTAALMWATAGIGMAVGFNDISLALRSTIICLAFMFVLTHIHRVLERIFPDEPEANLTAAQKAARKDQE
jgi:putative Mg2+ transporter-C (MgtC) family protein